MHRAGFDGGGCGPPEVADPERGRFITQTTLSLDETRDIVERLKERFPKIQGPAAQDICYATENRQVAVKAVVPLCELLLVVGSQNSSNSRGWSKFAKRWACRRTWWTIYSRSSRPWLENIQTVAVTAGASAPENLVEQLVAFLQDRGLRPDWRRWNQGRGRALQPACRTDAHVAGQLTPIARV